MYLRLAVAAVLVALAGAAAAAPLHAAGHPTATLVVLVAGASPDDARRAVAIGPAGEVYEPDGKGAWVHRLPSTTADPITAAGRAGASVVAWGGGALYRLAGNGWSAIRLVQHGKAVLGAGRRALAASGRQLFALDPRVRGEPTKLAIAPANIVAIGAGATAAVVVTEAGVFKLPRPGAPLVALPGLPAHLRPISDRWVLTDRGALDLTTKLLTPWPAGLSISVAGLAPDDALVAAGTSHGSLELMTLRGGTLTRDPLGIAGAAVGIVVDRKGRAAVALADGRIALRGPTGWSMTEVTAAPLADHAGSPPAVSN